MPGNWSGGKNLQDFFFLSLFSAVSLNGSSSCGGVGVEVACTKMQRTSVFLSRRTRATDPCNLKSRGIPIAFFSLWSFCFDWWAGHSQRAAMRETIFSARGQIKKTPEKCSVAGPQKGESWKRGLPNSVYEVLNILGSHLNSTLQRLWELHCYINHCPIHKLVQVAHTWVNTKAA